MVKTHFSRTVCTSSWFGDVPAGAPRFFVQELKRKQTRMALVHMVACNLGLSQGPQHAHATDTENNFLAQPVMQIAAV